MPSHECPARTSTNVRLQGRNQRRPADKGDRINDLTTFYRHLAEGRYHAAFRIELNAALARVSNAKLNELISLPNMCADYRQVTPPGSGASEHVRNYRQVTPLGSAADEARRVLSIGDPSGVRNTRARPVWIARSVSLQFQGQSSAFRLLH